MPKVIFHTSSGETVEVEKERGTLMEAAVANDIEGIDAVCGGNCSCATCHVRIAPEWREAVGPPNEEERDLLDIQEGVDESSRLSCQIQLTSQLDGLVVTSDPL
jgi:2Fe-2S ferredoxin